MTTPEPAELKPCQYCRIMPFVFNTHNPPNVIGGWMAMCGAVECKNPQASIGKTKAEATENWNTANSTPPAPVAEDAVEAMNTAIAESLLVEYSSYPSPVEVIRHLSARGYTLRRETTAPNGVASQPEAQGAPAMTEAELEREFRKLQTYKFTAQSKELMVMLEDALAIAKKFRR